MAVSHGYRIQHRLRTEYGTIFVKSSGTFPPVLGEVIPAPCWPGWGVRLAGIMAVPHESKIKNHPQTEYGAIFSHERSLLCPPQRP